MTTRYSMNDTLPKDATGLPFSAHVDIGTSQLDFALQAGVAASTTEGKRYAYMGIGTHSHSGSLTTNEPGVALLVKTGNPLTRTGNVQYLWGNGNGAIFISQEESFNILASSRVTASANNAHHLFGLYNGLSAINSSVIINLELMAETNSAYVLQTNTASGGYWLSSSMTEYKKMQPMTAGTASQLHFRNKTDGSNATVHFTIWRKDQY